MRNTLAKLTMIVSLGLFLVSSTGCATYAVYKGSEKVVATRKAMEIRDPKAKTEILSKIKSGDVDQTGLELPVMDVLKERPWWQAGAAVLDAGTAFLVKSGYDAMTDSGDDGQSSAARSADRNVAGGDQIFVQGNAGGDINVNLSAPEAVDGLGGSGGYNVPVGTGPQ